MVVLLGFDVDRHDFVEPDGISHDDEFGRWPKWIVGWHSLRYRTVCRVRVGRRDEGESTSFREKNHVGPYFARLDGGEHQPIHVLTETQPQVLEDNLRRQVAQLVVSRLGSRNLLDQRS